LKSLSQRETFTVLLIASALIKYKKYGTTGLTFRRKNFGRAEPACRRLRTASDDFSQPHGRCGLGASPVTDADLQRVEGSAPNERSELLVAPRHWGVHPRRMLAATPRVVVWGVLHNASLVRSSSYGRIDRVVSCRNANCCARVKGAGRAHERQKRQPGG